MSGAPRQEPFIHPSVLARAFGGDPRAFELLVAAHQARVFSFLLRLTGDRERAADLAQESFLRAFKNLARYDAARPFSTWILTLARHIFIDDVRARQARPEGIADGDELFAGMASEGDDPLSSVERGELARSLQSILTRLPAEQRVVVVAHDVESMALEDIAEMEGVPVGTVKSRLHRGHERLRALLLDATEPKAAAERMAR